MNMPHVTFKRWWKNGETVRVPLESPAAVPEVAPAPPPPPPAEAPWLKQLDRAGIPRTLNYPSTTLGRILDQSADRFGDVTALIYNHKRWTYRELLDQVNRTAAGLAGLGVRRAERVLLTLPNCPESVICFFAVQKLGGIVVNAGPLMGQDDLRSVIAMTHPHVAIGLDLLAPALIRAAHGSTLEHFVWVSLQFYQSVLKRVGYQMKLWQNRGVIAGALTVAAAQRDARRPAHSGAATDRRDDGHAEAGAAFACGAAGERDAGFDLDGLPRRPGARAHDLADVSRVWPDAGADCADHVSGDDRPGDAIRCGRDAGADRAISADAISTGAGGVRCVVG
jgi:hypothetical protein